MYDIEIRYSGRYPALCCAPLTVIVGGIGWDFGHCLSSGGSVWFGPGWEDHVESGAWSIEFYPEDFPADPCLRQAVVDAVNDSIRWGCCGGCI